MNLNLLISVQVYVQEASNPGKVNVYGPAIEGPIKTFEPTWLMVDCSAAGAGKCHRVLIFFFDLHVMSVLVFIEDSRVKVSFE